jgi:hypothetical protein
LYFIKYYSNSKQNIEALFLVSIRKATFGKGIIEKEKSIGS